MYITYLEGIMFDSFCLIVDSPLVSAQAVSQIQSRRLQTVCYGDLSQLVSFQLNLFFLLTFIRFHGVWCGLFLSRNQKHGVDYRLSIYSFYFEAV